MVIKLFNMDTTILNNCNFLMTDDNNYYHILPLDFILSHEKDIIETYMFENKDVAIWLGEPMGVCNFVTRTYEQLLQKSQISHTMRERVNTNNAYSVYQCVMNLTAPKHHKVSKHYNNIYHFRKIHKVYDYHYNFHCSEYSTVKDIKSFNQKHIRSFARSRKHRNHVKFFSSFSRHKTLLLCLMFVRPDVPGIIIVDNYDNLISCLFPNHIIITAHCNTYQHAPNVVQTDLLSLKFENIQRFHLKTYIISHQEPLLFSNVSQNVTKISCIDSSKSLYNSKFMCLYPEFSKSYQTDIICLGNLELNSRDVQDAKVLHLNKLRYNGPSMDKFSDIQTMWNIICRFFGYDESDPIIMNHIKTFSSMIINNQSQ